MTILFPVARNAAMRAAATDTDSPDNGLIRLLDRSVNSVDRGDTSVLGPGHMVTLAGLGITFSTLRVFNALHF